MKGLIVVIALMLLAGCGGDGGGDEVPMPDDGAVPLASDPSVTRLKGIVERTEVLLVPAVHVSYSVSALAETTADDVLQNVACNGRACAGSGLTFELTDAIFTRLIDPAVGISAGGANLQSRDDGFTTAVIQQDLDASDIGVVLPDATIVEIPGGLGYGIWGEHGMAGLAVAEGPYAGRVNAIPFSGGMKVAIPFAFGDVSGSNPEGVGGAAWTGVAEVVAIRTFRRQEGMARLTIADLAQPTVSVGIDVAGNLIGKPEWTEIPLADGHFRVGAAGDNYLEGNFHGVDHSEAYGVFDTDNFTGSFAAKQEGASE